MRTDDMVRTYAVKAMQAEMFFSTQQRIRRVQRRDLPPEDSKIAGNIAFAVARTGIAKVIGIAQYTPRQNSHFLLLLARVGSAI